MLDSGLRSGGSDKRFGCVITCLFLAFLTLWRTSAIYFRIQIHTHASACVVNSK